ncbi:13044_t:CDS:1, partial [Dentiscutata heterogama]
LYVRGTKLVQVPTSIDYEWSCIRQSTITIDDPAKTAVYLL